MTIRQNHNHVTTQTKPRDPGLQVLDYLGEMSRVDTEEEAIQRITQLFRFIFSGQEVIYVSLHGDLIVAVEPADTPPEVSVSLVQQSKSHKSRVAFPWYSGQLYISHHIANRHTRAGSTAKNQRPLIGTAPAGYGADGRAVFWCGNL
jgi:hypothetical protein